LKEGPEALARVRSALESELGLKKDAGTAELRSTLTDRTRTVSSHGVTLALERDVGGRTRLGAKGQSIGEDRALVDVLGQAVDTVGELRGSVADYQRDLDRLPVRALELERNVNEAFRLEGFGKAGEVRENLADARKVLDLLRPMLKSLDRDSAVLFDVLTSVLGVSAPEPPPPPSEPDPPQAEEPEPPKPRPRPARRTPPASRATPKPPPPAAAPASPPKPAPGPAKPDFEP
jgi:hypothetical protein